MGRVVRVAGVILLAALAGACATPKVISIERTSRGPIAAELNIVRSFAANGREPTFDEKRHFDDRLEERVFKYLREHPELQNEQRYSDFRFWRQVTPGSTKGEGIDAFGAKWYVVAANGTAKTGSSTTGSSKTGSY